MARRMTLEGAKVITVCELMPYSGGLARNIVQCLDDFGIPLRLSHTVVKIHGKERVTGVTIAKVDEANGRKPIPGTEEYIECDTLLLSVGLIPENELTRGAEIDLDRMTSGAAVNQYRETSAAGIYAAGNVLHVHDLVDYVSEEADIAGRAAGAKILGQTRETVKSVEVKTGCGVRYTVPERIDLSEGCENVRLFFRVTDVFKKVQLIAETESGKIIAKRAKTAAAPGEMESLEIPAEALAELMQSDDSFIKVYLIEKGE